MAIDFPNSPVTGDRFTVGDKVWVYNGSQWDIETAYVTYGHAGTHAAAGIDPITISQSQVTGLSTSITNLNNFLNNGALPSTTGSTGQALLSQGTAEPIWGNVWQQSDYINTSGIRIGAASLSGTLDSGQVENDGTNAFIVHQSLGSPNGRSYINTSYYKRLTSTKSLTSDTSFQSIFGQSLSIATNTYYAVEMFVMLNTGTTNAHTVAVGFGGTATWTASNFTWQSEYQTITAGGTPTAALHKWNTTMTNGTSQVIGSSNTNATKSFLFGGLFTTSSAGTFTPSVQFSTGPGGTNTVASGSWVRITPVNVAIVGSWA